MKKTAINATNLNRIDYALDEVDNRVISLDDTKLDLSTANGLIESIELDEATGIFTITYLSGDKKYIDTLLEKLAINFDYDARTQKLIIYLSDGTTKEIDMSELITQYEFLSSEQITFQVIDGKVKATVLDGSITRRKLDPDYLAEIDVNVAKAELAASNANASALEATKKASDSESSANRSDESAKTAAAIVDNAKKILSDVEFKIGENGHLYYKTDNENITFRVDPVTGRLQFKII